MTKQLTQRRCLFFFQSLDFGFIISSRFRNIHFIFKARCKTKSQNREAFYSISENHEKRTFYPIVEAGVQFYLRWMKSNFSRHSALMNVIIWISFDLCIICIYLMASHTPRLYFRLRRAFSWHFSLMFWVRSVTTVRVIQIYWMVSNVCKIHQKKSDIKLKAAWSFVHK